MSEEKNNKKLEAIRHSLSHLMSMAVEEQYPKVGLGVGPVIENGFYQDYDLPEAITPEILPKLEKRMKELIKQNIKFAQHDVDYKEAYKFYKHDPYKTWFIDDLKAQGEKKVSFYKSDWFDNLCGGPHVKSTKEINPDAFKLTHIAGAYWRGDEKNKMLTRIYGLAFATKQELNNYLKIMEEAEKRDHRKLGKELDLFLIDPTVGMGLVMWQPKGAMLWRIMEDFWYKEHLKNGYDLVRSPHIGSRALWETSGHWDFYSESMFPVLEVGQTLKDAQEGKKVEVKEEYLLKPMNCPFHVTLYNSRPKSYRDLPIRWAECGTVYRYEKSGELSGLTRVRGFTQDDAHIICTKEQAEEELKKVLDFIVYIFKSFGFNDYKVYLSLRDPSSNKYAGDNAGWNFTESVLEKVAKEKKLDVVKDVGGAVFYGPKLDFKIKDCLGREWQCSTLQYDFNLPEKFNMAYIGKSGKEERPYVLHRALFGSFERFIGVLIEHFAGVFPVWLSPVQVKIVSVSAAHVEFSKKLADEFKENDIRVEVDESDETVGNKIRKAIGEKVPYMLVVGDKEMQSDKLAVRDRGEKTTREISKKEFIEEVKEKTKLRK